MSERIAVVGLGYVGLPLAIALAAQHEGTLGFDVDQVKLDRLRRGDDPAGEIESQVLAASKLRYSSDPADLAACTFIIVCVPTPVDQQKRPDLKLLRLVSETVGRILRPGAIVVYESTVYPGVTEDVCAPILARESGLRRGIDFHLGYSPERINPGDKQHTLARVVKIVSAEDGPSLERVAAVYESIVPAGVHRAPSIKVAEAAKVIENTQRDLNIALMNELAIIFDRLNIRTADVLAAANTKWNFLPFTPGLVGGHCIGVDPYYLTSKAEEVGYHPQVILSGRRINDGMGTFLAQRLVKLLVGAHCPVNGARVAVLGLTFKENVSDLRNSRVVDIIRELKDFGIDALVHDPLAEPDMAHHEYGLSLTSWDQLAALDAMVLAVPHRFYREMAVDKLLSPLNQGGVVLDIKSMLQKPSIPQGLSYWSL